VVYYSGSLKKRRKMYSNARDQREGNQKKIGNFCLACIVQDLVEDFRGGESLYEIAHGTWKRGKNVH